MPCPKAVANMRLADRLYEARAALGDIEGAREALTLSWVEILRRPRRRRRVA